MFVTWSVALLFHFFRKKLFSFYMDCQQHHLCCYVVSEYVVLRYLFNKLKVMFKLDIIVKTLYQETAKSKQVALVIILFIGHLEQCNDLLE